MDSSTVGAPLPNRRPESRRGSASRFSEHLDGTIHFFQIDPFRVNLFSKLRDDPFLASLVGGSDATRLLVTRQARSGPSSLTTSLPPPHRNSRPTVPPSPQADRSPTPPRDRAGSPAADRIGSALELAVSQLVDRLAAQSTAQAAQLSEQSAAQAAQLSDQFSAQAAAQAAAFSEMMKRFEGLHRERGFRSTACNADDTPIASATSSSTSHVAPRPIASNRQDPNLLAAPSTAYSVAPNASTRPPLPFSVMPALTASAAPQSLISLSAPISSTVIAPSTRAPFVPVPLAVPTSVQSVPLAAD